MLRIDDLQLFVRTADSGSLSAAARGLDVSPAVASAALKRLEASLGARLFARSTRSLRLTAEGGAYLLHARAALASLHEGAQTLAGGREAIRGVLQLSAPSDFGRNVLLPWLDEFQARHPQLQLRLLLGDGLTDLFRQPVDLVLRYGEPQDSSLVALPVAAGNRRVLCASPACSAMAPQRLDELAGHNCLRFMLAGRVHDRWCFQEGRRARTVQVSGDRVSDDADVVRRWALAGLGLAYKSWLDIADDVTAGRLRVLLPECLGEAAPLGLLCAHRAQLSKPVRLLHEHLQARCAALLTRAPWAQRAAEEFHRRPELLWPLAILICVLVNRMDKRIMQTQRFRNTWQLAVVVLMSWLLAGCGINNIPRYDEQVKSAWSQVENQYQRRADLIPNLVETVKGFARQEQETLTAVVEARARATRSRSMPIPSTIRRSCNSSSRHRTS